jgi:hypothetical protein
LKSGFVSFIRLGPGPGQIGRSIQDDEDDPHFSMYLNLGVVYEQAPNSCARRPLTLLVDGAGASLELSNTKQQQAGLKTSTAKRTSPSASPPNLFP